MSRAPGAIARILVWRPGLMLIYLASMVILARLLPPEAFGAFAIAAAVHLFADTLVDFGIGAHLVRDKARELAPETLSSAFGLWLVVAGATTALLAAVALVVGALDPVPGLATALWPIVLALPLAPWIKIRETQALRALDTRVLAWLPLTGAVASLAVAAGCALAEWGAASLTMGILAEKITLACVLTWVFRHHTPIRPALSGWGPLLRFGPVFTATDLLPKITDVARLSVIGGTLGAAALGLLNRALQVASLNDRVVIDAVLPIAMPVMADASRAGTPPAEIYAMKIAYLSALCWPAAAVIAVMAEPLVLLLLGPVWLDTVLPVQILCLGAVGYPVRKMGGKFFVLIGAERRMLRLQLIQKSLEFALVCAAAFHSLLAVCAAIALAETVAAGHMAVAIKRLVSQPKGALAGPVLRGIVITAGSLCAPLAVMVFLPGLAPGAAIALGLAGAFAGWVLAVWAVAHPLARDVTLLARRAP